MRAHKAKQLSVSLFLAAGTIILCALSPQFLHAHRGLTYDITRVTELLRNQPDRADLRIRRGRLYRLNGDWLASLADLNRARKLAPNDPEAALERGMILSALRRDIEAEAELNRCLQSDRPFAAAYAQRARIRIRTGRRTSAIKDYSAAIQIRPRIDWYLTRGQLQESLGQLHGAARGYRDGLTRLNGAVLIRLALIRVEVEQRRYDQALALIDPVLKHAQIKTDWYRRRAEILAAAGRNEEAKRQFRLALAEAEHALQQRPTAINLVSRAKVYTAMGRNADALTDLRQALHKAPRFPDAFELLAKLQGRSQERKKSEL